MAQVGGSSGQQPCTVQGRHQGQPLRKAVEGQLPPATLLSWVLVAEWEGQGAGNPESWGRKPSPIADTTYTSQGAQPAPCICWRRWTDEMARCGQGLAMLSLKSCVQS